MNEGLVLRYFVDNQKGKTKKSIYTDLGIAKQTFYQYFESNKLTEDVKKKIGEYFKTDIFTEDNYAAALEYIKKVSTDEKNIDANENTHSPGQIDKLIDATRILAEANKIYAEAHRKIADTNERLSVMLEKKSIASDAQQMIEGALARQRAIQEVLQVYAKEGKPINVERFEADVNTRIDERARNGIKKERTQNDSGNSRRL